MGDIFEFLMPKTNQETIRNILQATNGGKDLSDFHSRLVDYGVKNYLNERGIAAVERIWQAILAGEYRYDMDLE